MELALSEQVGLQSSTAVASAAPYKSDPNTIWKLRSQMAVLAPAVKSSDAKVKWIKSRVCFLKTCFCRGPQISKEQPQPIVLVQPTI